VDPPESLTKKPEQQGRDGEQAQGERTPGKERQDEERNEENPDQSAGDQERENAESDADDRDDGKADTKGNADHKTKADTKGKGDRAGDDHNSRTGVRMRSGPRPGSTYTVRAGDHLWKIATQVVSAHGDATGRRAVASYWATLVRAATPHLRSGDPNLIYPGETLELPPLGYQTED
jgi:nucleoid-associated protein YgaU